MRDKKEAETMEKRLLGVFNYAWNRIGNGPCRREDIISKLNKALSNSNVGLFSKFIDWERHFGTKLGIKIAPGLPLAEDESEQNKRGFIPQILKYVNSRPWLVKPDDKLYQYEEICGVAVGFGCVCLNKPVPGRKRCSNHKGKRITGITRVTSRDNRTESFEPAFIQGTCNFGKEYDTCGIAYGDGLLSQKGPVPGRKRCEPHKGKRIAILKLFAQREDRHVEGTQRYNLEVEICGVSSGDGLVCRSIPVPGRKRCELHKGQRVTAWSKTLASKEHSSMFGDEVNICHVDIGNELICKTEHRDKVMKISTKESSRGIAKIT